MADSSQQPQQHHPQESNVNSEERQPLLARTIQNTLLWTRSSLEADRGDPETQDEINRKEEEEETQWLAELRRRPWRLRPTSYWLIPWTALCGVVSGLCITTMRQLRGQIICRDLLAGSMLLGLEKVHSSAPIDECLTPTMLSMIRQVESRIVTISSISLLITLAKWCSLSDIYGRKVLFHIGLAGTAIYIILNLFAVSRLNIFGYYVYYLEALSSALLPAGAVLNPAIFGYCSDCSPKYQRGRLIGYIVAALGVGTMSGSALGSYITITTGDRTVVLRVALIAIAFLAIYLTFVPESLRRKPISPTAFFNNHSNREQGAQNDHSSSILRNVVAFFRDATSVIMDPVLAILPGRIPVSSNTASTATPLLVLLVHFLVSLSTFGKDTLLESMTSLVFRWDTVDNEHLDTFTSLVMTAVLLGLLPLWNAAYKAWVMSDMNEQSENSLRYRTQQSSLSYQTRHLSGLEAIKMDLFFSICGLSLILVSDLLVAIFPSSTMLYIAGCIIAVGVISEVSIISVLSSTVPNHLVGAVYGAHSICYQSAKAVSGLTFEPLFMRSKESHPLFYFYVSAILITLALLIQLSNWLSYYQRY